jgi:hypothetical protein
MKLTAKQVKMYHKDEDWVQYIYNDGILSGMMNEYIDITLLLEDIVSEWEWPGKMFDDFGSNNAVQMVNVICVRVEKEFGIDPHKSHQYQFFNFMRYCFDQIKARAIKLNKITNN